VVRHAEAPKDLEKRVSRNRVESLDQVDNQRVRFKAVLLTFAQVKMPGSVPSALSNSAETPECRRLCR
jgi:hypothetical protein